MMEEIILKDFPIPFDVDVEEYDYIYQVQVGFNTKCRDDGKLIKLFYRQNFFKEDYTRAQAIRITLINALIHEVDECLLVNNKRIFDPHKEELYISYPLT